MKFSLRMACTTVCAAAAAVLMIAAPRAYSFTEGKTIRIIDGLPPGGGHDIEGRLIARYITKYLPGKPRAIVKSNMPGAAGLVMTAHFVHRVKPDGLTWAVMGTTQTSSQVLSPPQKYDLREIPILFSHSGPGATIVRDFLGVKKAEDITKVDPAKIVVSGRTLTGSSFLTDALGLELLGVKGYKYVVGYQGSARMAQAFFSGEISYVGGTGLHHALGKSGLYHGAINDGTAFLLWQTGVSTPEGEIVRLPGTDTPTIAEVYQQMYGKKPSGQLWEAYKLVGPTVRTLNRYLTVPPGTPPDRVAILRKAFDQLYSDPEYVKEWEKIFGLQLFYVPGQDADKIMKELVNADTPGWVYINNEFIPHLKEMKN